MYDVIIIFCAKYLIYIDILMFLAFLFLARRRVRGRLIVMTVIAGVFAYVIARIAALLWYDPRPFVESGIVPLIAHAADNGFPSDHMLLAGTLASVVMFRNARLSIIFWLVAIAIGASRVLAHIHHSIDIIASAIIGIVSAYIAFEIVVLRRMRANRVRL